MGSFFEGDREVEIWFLSLNINILRLIYTVMNINNTS